MAFKKILDRRGDPDYSGKAEQVTFTFSTIPEQFPGEQWLADRIIDKIVGQLAGQNSKMLYLRVWRDTSPTWQTHYKVELTASASPLWWNLIILSVLAIFSLILTWQIVNVVEDIFWREDGTEPGLVGALKWGTLAIIAVLGIALVTKGE